MNARGAKRLLLVVGLAACVGAGFVAGRGAFRGAPDEGGTAAAPAVVTAIRDVARLESTRYHVEKVIEVSDEQSHVWGLVQSKDVLLLVAVGEVAAGVDLGKLKDEDVRVDAATRSVAVRLPRAEVFSSALDTKATHVYSRSTDLLADRKETLEGDARRRAEEEMRKAALEEGILERAQTSAERTLRSLLRSLGYEHVAIDWNDRG
jgi:hypothetical protein